MAVDMFIKIGSVEGESRDGNGHGKEIDVLNWTWGMENSTNAHVGGGQGAGKVKVRDLKFTKYVDKATPDLMLACCNGKHFPEAKLVIRKQGEMPLEYLTITMSDLIIADVTTRGQPYRDGSNPNEKEDDRLTEEVTLNFAKVKVDYKEQTQTGGVGASTAMGWDIAGNKKV
jgi:type VI secretion system secreted protein Hcp